MPANRCARCMLSWPVRPEYKRCPNCGEATVHSNYSQAMGLELARKKLRLAFNRFYDKRDLERQEQGEMSPAEIGRMEARQELERQRAGKT